MRGGDGPKGGLGSGGYESLGKEPTKGGKQKAEGERQLGVGEGGDGARRAEVGREHPPQLLSCPSLAKGQGRQRDVSIHQPCLALVQRKYSLKDIKMK